MNTQTTLSKDLQSKLVAERKQRLNQLGNIEHRLEFVDEVNGVEYINDAKATDVNSTWYSLDCIDKPLIWIMSSSQYETDLTLYGELNLSGVKAIIVMGSNQKEVETFLLHKTELVGRVNTVMQAVEHAQLISNSGDVVLFSPSCSDFDSFRNFKDAGQQFRKAVRETRL